MAEEFNGYNRVDWEVAREANRANWDDRAPIHAASTEYGLERYVADPHFVNAEIPGDARVIAEATGREGTDLSGLDIVHLQCHIGTDTVSLARLGAQMTGLDISRASLDVAADLAARAGHPDIRWVEADVLDAATALGDTYDVVHTSVGAICWVADLDAWARTVAALLRDGGVLHVRDTHQALLMLDDSGEESVPRPRYRYFNTDEAETSDGSTTYNGEGEVSHTRTYTWPHPLSEVVNALIGAGLRIERLDEGRELSWQYSPLMTQLPSGTWVWPEELRDVIPCTFTVVARK